MNDVNRMKERDRKLVTEARVKVLARLIGYNEIGEAIELVFIPKDNTYEIHVGGEFVKTASSDSVKAFVPGILQIAL